MTRMLYSLKRSRPEQLKSRLSPKDTGGAWAASLTHPATIGK
jgi:hypothetical protein